MPASFSPESSKWREFVRQGAEELGVDLDGAQVRRLSVHAAELARWNQKINLTAITDPKEAAIKHFLDSLAPLPLIPENTCLADLGTGGGFPGIPLKIAKPSLTVTLIESTQKKISFLKQVIRLLEVRDIDVISARIEEIANRADFCHRFDTVICRAFSSLEKFVKMAHERVAPEGRLIAMKKNSHEEIRQVENLPLSHDGREIPLSQMFTVETRSYRLPVIGEERLLIILNRR